MTGTVNVIFMACVYIKICEWFVLRCIGRGGMVGGEVRLGYMNGEGSSVGTQGHQT